MGRVRALLASGNPHKLDELRAALPGFELGLLDAGELPPEDGSTYYENALGKAFFGREAGDPEAWVLGEDSGIEVDGLGGEPGLHSARWAGDEDPVEALLQRLAGIEGKGRRARYRCELVAFSPRSLELRGTGVLKGGIVAEPRGSEGFGYDPIFIPEGETLTVAELGDEWKREHSHRALAARDLADRLARHARDEASDAELVRTFNAAAEPLYADLRAAGLPTDGFGVFMSARGARALGAPPPFDYERSVPYLLKWLPLIDEPRVKETIARSLCTKFARPIAVRPLLAEFRKAAGRADNLALDIVSDLEEVADDTVFDDLVPFATDRSLGFDRAPIILALGRMKDPRAVDVLIGQLDDAEVTGTVLHVLRKLAPVDARSAIEPFADHTETWVRNEARAALKKIDKKRAAGT